MQTRGRAFSVAVALLALTSAAASPAEAQGKHGKKYAVSGDRAISVTRAVLDRQGYDVVRVERVGASRVVYYRRGNNGRGKGKGPLEKLVIRSVENRIVFEDTPPAVLVDIDLELKL